MPGDASDFTGYATTAGPFLGLLAMLLAAGLATWVLALWWTARLIHRPPRYTPERCFARLGRATPDDVGLDYRDDDYDVPDAANPGGGRHRGSRRG